VAALLHAEATMARIAMPVSAVQRAPAAPPTLRGEPKTLIPLSSSSAVGGKWLDKNPQQAEGLSGRQPAMSSVFEQMCRNVSVLTLTSGRWCVDWAARIAEAGREDSGAGATTTRLHP
jgi:hypothetical protein